MLTSKEKQLRILRRKEYNELIEKHNIKTTKLALVTGFSTGAISSFKSGQNQITEKNWEDLLKGIQLIVAEQSKMPNVEVEAFNYVINMLKLHGNVVVKKNKIKDTKKYIDDLKLNGFKCKIEVDRDGDYVITDINRHKPVMEVITKPKKEVLSDVAEIGKIRKMHEDALKLEVIKEVLEDKVVPGEYIKVTEDDIKEALELYDHIDDEDKDDVTNRYTLNGPEVIKEESIEITEKDLVEAVKNNEMVYTLPPAEEQQFKELAEEQMVKCGILKESKEDSFINFLKTRFTKEELKGFIRGISILSVMDEDYQLAAYYIDHFINQGYIEG